MSAVSPDDPMYDDVKAGAWNFTWVLGTVSGKRVIKWNGLYDGRGGMLMGEYFPPVDHFLELGTTTMTTTMMTTITTFWKFFTTPKNPRDKQKRSLARAIKVMKTKSTRPQKKKR